MRLRLFFLLLWVPLAKGQQMTHEEQVVRTTYARLSYATQVNEVHRAIADAAKGKMLDNATLSQRLKAAELIFVLSDFKVGNVTDADIGQTKYSDLMAKPSGDMMLDISHGVSTFGTDSPANGSQLPQQTKSVIAMVQWGTAQQVTEDWNQPWSKVYPSIENATWFTTYASFKVRVSFQGRSREYPALFLFGHNPTTGAEYIIPGDTIAGLTGALHFFATNNVYPEALIEGGVGKDIPAVHDWLNEQASPTGKSHDDNCDPATAKCGVSSQDMNKLEKLRRPNTSQIRAIPRKANPPRLVEVGFSSHRLHPMVQAAAPTTCAGFSKTIPHSGFVQDGTKHTGDIATNNHTLIDSQTTSCTYTTGSSNTCDTSCNVNVNGESMGETHTGETGFCHAVNSAVKNDTVNGVGAGADCGGGVGGGVKECIGCLCGVTVSVTSSGASVSITSDGFYTANDGLGVRCAAQANPQATPTPTPIPIPPTLPPPPCDPCLGCLIAGGPIGDFNKPDCSPIIIDLTGDGFALTSAANGVLFDISNTGHPVQIAWTGNANNAFLALDRNGNGVINSGAELFGNFTPQPASAHPNGFLALAVYDDPAHGGNGDGIIDARDAIFSQLRLWVDANHDGISQPGELHTLPEMGIYSISLDYSLSERTDQYGNVFRYKARVNKGANGSADVGKSAYDVFLVAR